MGIVDAVKETFGFSTKPKPQTTASKAREVSEEEKKEVASWMRRLKRAEGRPERKDWTKKATELREAVKGQLKGQTLRENLIFATLNVILVRIYARQPKIAVRAAERVSGKEYPWLTDFGKTLELLINQQLRRAELKRHGKGWVRGAMTVAFAWLKVTYQRDYDSDPEINNRIADTQDNLARVERLIAEIGADDAEDTGDMDLKKRELEQQLEGLRAKLEVEVSQGIVVDRIDPADLIEDDGVGLEDYKQSGFIAQKIWVAEEEFPTKYKIAVPENATRYTRGQSTGDSYTYSPAGKDATSATEQQTSGKWLCVYEIWDRGTQSIFTALEGASQWVREPFRLEQNGRRFYPFFLLAFNWVDGEAYPMSDVAQWLPLQEDAQDRDQKRTDFIKAYKPGLITNASGLKKEQITHFVTAEGLEVTAIESADPIGTAFIPRPNPPFDERIYDTADIHAKLDIVSGAGDAAKGGVLRAKTATEAAIVQQGLSDRSTDRRDMIEDVLSEVGEYVGEILLQELTKEQVLTMVGGAVSKSVDPESQQEVETLEAVWPELSREQIYNLVQIEVEAGSTGKPNQQAERETLTQLFPLLKEAMQQIVELRTGGKAKEAQGLIKLVDYGLRTMDERLSIEMFIPDAMDEEPPPPDPQQIAVMQKQIDLLSAEIGQTRSQTILNLAKASQAGAPEPQTMTTAAALAGNGEAAAH